MTYCNAPHRADQTFLLGPGNSRGAVLWERMRLELVVEKHCGDVAHTALDWSCRTSTGHAALNAPPSAPPPTWSMAPSAMKGARLSVSPAATRLLILENRPRPKRFRQMARQLGAT